MERVLLTIFLAFSLAWGADELPERLRPYEDKFLIGYEIELKEAEFARIADYFDYEEWQKRTNGLFTGTEFLNGYVRNPQTWAQLPPEIQNGITAIMRQRRLSYNPGTFSEKDFRWKHVTQAWDIFLQESWREVPADMKKSAVNVSLLSMKQKTEIMWSGMQLKTKAGAPAIFDKLQWNIEGNDVLEFRHINPRSTLSDFWRDLHAFQPMTEYGEAFFDPRMDSDLALHYHVSTKAESNLKPVADRLNSRLFLRAILGGREDTDYTAYAYRPNIAERGYLRLIAKNRIEFRFHDLDTLEEAMAYNFKAMTLSQSEALAFIDRDLNALARQVIAEKPGILSSLAAWKPENVKRIFLFLPLAEQEKLIAIVRHGANPTGVLSFLSEVAMEAAPESAVVRKHVVLGYNYIMELHRVGRLSDDNLIELFTKYGKAFDQDPKIKSVVRAQLAKLSAIPVTTVAAPEACSPGRLRMLAQRILTIFSPQPPR